MLALIPIEAGRLIVSARNKQVEFAIAVKIPESACHVSIALTVWPQARPRRAPDFFKRTVFPVVVQVGRPVIIRHIEVGPAVAVVIAPHHTHAMKFVGVVYSRFLGYFFKRAVATIPK